MKKIIFIFGIALMTVACENKTASTVETNDSIVSDTLDTIASDTICVE